MKNIIMFSSLHSNKKINKRVSRLLKNRTIAYIPARLYDGTDCYCTAEYIAMGFEKYIVAPLGFNYSEARMNAALKCDAIHIGGGNTFELLYIMKHRGLMEKLIDFVNRGGILMGNSAGSIIMCPSIDIAQFADRNYIGSEDLKALGLVDFDMKPHWDFWGKYSKEFEEYQHESGRDLYCLKENQAIFVSDNQITFYGGTPKKFC